ncbi:hypothetical protein MMC26_004630 [Xylographa opegraphella]|nr:hypothetical protein [Xylographa opegraphella]
MPLSQYDWILAVITIAFCCSAFGNGANDVANSYATSVAAQTLKLWQAGILAIITEFVGAVALGARVTSTIKNSIIDINRFNGKPGVLILAMACSEVGSATWLFIATRLGFPVSTTQTIVGALIGVGYASGATVTWGWEKGSVSQVAASWAIAPCLAGAIAAVLFATLKYAVLERRDPFKWAMRLIPFYLAFTAGILALFIVIEAPSAPSLEEFGAGKVAGIILGVFFGMLIIAYVFFVPYFHRRLVKNDARVKFWHIPLGPMLWKDDPWLYFPARDDGPVVIDYYEGAHHARSAPSADNDILRAQDTDRKDIPAFDSPNLEANVGDIESKAPAKVFLEPRARFLRSTDHLPLYKPARMWAWLQFILLQGVSRDCITFDSEHLRKSHALAKRYDNRVEHLWTYAQVASAMLMSIAHGSNDVANAVGPWSAAYATYQAGTVETKSPTPVWILAVAGLLLGAGFWFFGFHVVRSLGNRITQVSPTRGYAMELGSAITVLLASRLALPVSTTQCLTGAAVGVALMNFSLGAVNWRQLLFILSGWILTLPIAGLISGLLLGIALNTPHF